MEKGFTLLEIVIVLTVLGIMTTIALPLYQDYTKKSRTAEVPFMIKNIVELQVARKADPSSGGEYAKALLTLDWTTSMDTTEGKFFEFGTSGVDGCDPGTLTDPLPIGLGEFWVLDNSTVTNDWRSGCMTSSYDMLRNSH